MAEPTIKGGILLSRLRFVRDRAGEAALERVLGRLSASDQYSLRGPLLAASWYPLALNLRLDDAIAAELSPNNRSEIFLEMGRKSADVNLTGAHKVWITEGDPHAFLAKSPRIYGMYYAVGHRTYEKTGERRGVIKTFDAENVTGTDCLTVIGWYIRAIEMCGGRNVRITETRCRAKGGTYCEYLCEWD